MLRYHVEGVCCGRCVQRLCAAVDRVNPGADVVVELGTEAVTVWGAKDSATIVSAIREAGFSATLVDSRGTRWSSSGFLGGWPGG